LDSDSDLFKFDLTNSLSMQQPPHAEPKKNYFTPTMGLALCIVRHPGTGRFLLVHETGNRGWWLPAGKVDPGENFHTSAVRECVEEAGIHVQLKGVIRFEHGLYGGYARLRVVFYGEPIDLNEQPKAFADYESLEAKWVTVEDVEAGAYRLRGSEPLEFFRFIANGNHVLPMTCFVREGDPVRLREPSASFQPVPPAAPAVAAPDSDKKAKKKKKKTTKKTKTATSAAGKSGGDSEDSVTVSSEEPSLPV
jgi:8-oxo-dGTP pyrophosphatase MutT (NUDIX family)